MSKQKIGNTFMIEKGIPKPESRSMYPFFKMEIGDSFSFDASKNKPIRTYASMYGIKNNKKFSFVGNRCWRIK